ncbi:MULTISPECIES: GIY-YIG nuclease family protein [unclassified Frondihabitans]|uniref:GIY-YIG nuclease family protein n=1 Tax=unclassified Frondihabitans TaxID=2626248 RepID=UPI000F4DCCF3|nr:MULTISPECIES: hypothetical protein [unclassified Frondihabitans]RPE73819.1 hypothetical protein EDF37_3367 [Frondihabitans sp. PhB153]RPF04072.1 hypothetical protein EDF39_2491 [Frondihabitans sp. PhB161]
MTLSDLAADAVAVLTGTRWSITDAPAHVPARPGLYAIYGDEQAHRELGLLDDLEARSAPDLPLYVGKAEASFVSRDLKDHFAAVPGSTARTGGSTVRRSFAALLRDSLDLQGIPRNLAKPADFSMYSLAGDGDARLTAWMHQRLRLAVWEAPNMMQVALVDAETELIRHFTPVINLDKNPKKLVRLKVARKAMAAEARAWRPVEI